MEKELGFLSRHIGLKNSDISLMLNSLGLDSLDQLIKKVIPRNIYSPTTKKLLDKTLSETEAIHKLKEYSEKNLLFKSYIGMGYYGTIVPNVIKRNILLQTFEQLRS